MYICGKDAETKEIKPGITRKMLSYNDDLMTCEFSFKEGAKLPVHVHPHTQTSYVLSGEMEFATDEKATVVKAGDSILVPGNVSHCARALTDACFIETYTPKREDFLK